MSPSRNDSWGLLGRPPENVMSDPTAMNLWRALEKRALDARRKGPAHLERVMAERDRLARYGKD